MAFILQNLGRATVSQNSTAPIGSTYFHATDTLATIMADDYFLSQFHKLLVNNVMTVVASDETTFIYVTESSSTSVKTDFFLDTAGPLHFKGPWNANTNTPTLVSGVGSEGSVYIVSVAGTTNLDGITDWEVGDWAAFNGTVWTIIENTQLPFFTQYAVPFGDALGSLAEDPLNFSFDNTKDQLSIGAPNTTVMLNAQSRNGSFLAVSDGVPEKWGVISQAFGTSTNAVFLMTRARANQSAPQPSNLGDVIGEIAAAGYDGVDYGECSEILTVASANHSSNNTPADMQFRITPAGSDVPVTAMTIKSDKSLLVDESIAINASSTISSLNTISVPAKLFTEYEDATMSAFRASHAGLNFVEMAGQRSRGTLALPTIVLDGDTGLSLNSYGYDGSTFRPMGSIDFKVDGTPGLADMPGKIRFNTVPNGATTPSVRMVIRENGFVGIGTETPAYDLHVFGDTVESQRMAVENNSAVGLVNAGIICKNPSQEFFVGISNGPVTQRFVLYDNLANEARIVTERVNKNTLITDNGVVDAPDASAALEVSSTTKGFLPPQMTTVQRDAIGTPASGLMVFNTTTSQWEGYNGTSWVILG